MKISLNSDQSFWLTRRRWSTWMLGLNVCAKWTIFYLKACASVVCANGWTIKTLLLYGVRQWANCASHWVRKCCLSVWYGVTLTSTLELTKFYELTLLPFLLRIIKKVKKLSRTLLEDTICYEDSIVQYYARHLKGIDVKTHCFKEIYFAVKFLYSPNYVSSYSF